MGGPNPNPTLMFSLPTTKRTTQTHAVSLPQDVVGAFNGKTMAIVGFEIDQVLQKDDGQADVSVPINVVYNHHFESQMAG